MMKENRGQLGSFEVIDFADRNRIGELRGPLEVDTLATVHWNNWDCGSGVSERRALCEKGKAKPWNASTGLDGRPCPRASSS